jgi:hypothetical protein
MGGWSVLGLGLVLFACSEAPRQIAVSSGGAPAEATSDARDSAGEGGKSALRDAGSRSPADAGQGALDTADAGFCSGQAVTIAELASGSVRQGASVLLPELVASSQKFLLSVSKSTGACWWAAVAAAAGVVGENSGVLLLSKSASAADTAGSGAPECPPDQDALPVDLAPGDQLAAYGNFEDYAPAACHGRAPMRELLIKPGCAVNRTGHGEPPSAAVITPELADRLAQGSDTALLRAWSGARNVLAALDPRAVDGSPSAVGPYGVMSFAQTKLALHSKIPYADLSGDGVGASGKALSFSYPVHFARARGVLFLDYCTWSLELCDPCADLSPQSPACGSSAP